MLKFTNTLANSKETFKPIFNNNVSLYVCGITPYDYAHIGHGRCYIIFDVLYRLLKSYGYQVKYCRNYTDIDDKLINRAERELSNKFKYNIIADKFIKAYQKDLKALNCISPDYEPRVTEHIPEIITFIKGLVDKGYAYKINNDIYFDISKFKEYGKLSKRSTEDLQAGARITVRKEKKSPLDFALWKSEKEGTFWQSPWGSGRPGWHIECSTLAKKYLGDTIDIHGGGMDLIFPHHENEIAQTECSTGKDFVKFWIHNAFVRINKEKMSKSLGNFFTLREILEQINPMVLRYYILQHNYRIPLDFSFEDLKVAEKSYNKLANFFKDDNQSIKAVSFSVEDYRKYDVTNKLINTLSNDLNVARVFGIIFENLKDMENNINLKLAVKSFIENILGIKLLVNKDKNKKLTPEAKELIKERDQARKNKDWHKADKIRDQLLEMGISLQDYKA